MEQATAPIVKIKVSLPRELREQLKAHAKQQLRSVNSEILISIQERIGRVKSAPLNSVKG